MRLLIIPIGFLVFGFSLLSLFAGDVVFLETVEESVAWLRGFEQWAWAVGTGLIIGDWRAG